MRSGACRVCRSRCSERADFERKSVRRLPLIRSPRSPPAGLLNQRFLVPSANPTNRTVRSSTYEKKGLKRSRTSAPVGTESNPCSPYRLYNPSDLPGRGVAKPVVAHFDLPDASADGSLVLFKALDTALGLTRRLAGCLDDAREPGTGEGNTDDELVEGRPEGCCHHQALRALRSGFPIVPVDASSGATHARSSV